MACALRVPTLRQPLVDAHAFRQTQTAYTARLFHEEGIDLLHPRLPVLDERGEVPFEFPLFQAIASIPMDLGLSPDTAMRVTSLVFFLASGLLLYGLVRDLMGVRTALLAVTVFLFSPFSMVWSRAALIEYLAIAGSLAFFWGAILWRRMRHPAYAVAALTGGGVGMLVKPTTAFFWIIPLLVHETRGRAKGWRAWIVHRRDPVLVAIIVIPVLAGALWTRHADAIKAAHPATEWLTSRALGDWNFGTVAQRLQLANWGSIGGRVQALFVGIPLWLLAMLFIVPLQTPRLRPLLLGIGASAVATVAVFFNLYVVHDYYLAAIAAQLAILLGAAVSSLLDRVAPHRRRGVILVLAVWFAAVTFNGRDYWLPSYDKVSDPALLLPVAEEVAAHTNTTDRIVFQGLDWSPVVPYYAHRTGTMIPATQWTPQRLATLSPDDFDTVVTGSYSGDTAVLLSKWEWVAPRSARVFNVARTLRPLGDADIVAGATATAGWPGTGATALVSSPLRLTCNQGFAEIPTGSAATWLRFDGYPEQAIVIEELTRGSVPANRTVVVRNGVVPPGNPLRVGCVGRASLQLMAAVDAPPPPGW